MRGIEEICVTFEKIRKDCLINKVTFEKTLFKGNDGVSHVDFW